MTSPQRRAYSRGSRWPSSDSETSSDLASSFPRGPRLSNVLMCGTLCSLDSELIAVDGASLRVSSDMEVMPGAQSACGRLYVSIGAAELWANLQDRRISIREEVRLD